jgi:hypothetical protein
MDWFRNPQSAIRNGNGGAGGMAACRVKRSAAAENDLVRNTRAAGQSRRGGLMDPSGPLSGFVVASPVTRAFCACSAQTKMRPAQLSSGGAGAQPGAERIGGGDGRSVHAPAGRLERLQLARDGLGVIVPHIQDVPEITRGQSLALR